MKGKVVFVAGGAGYLAFPVCRSLLEEGASVMIGDFNKENLDKAIENLVQDFSEDRVCGIVFDIGDENSINQAISATVEKMGHLDVLVNATYFSVGKSVKDLLSEEFDLANKINITGSFLLARKAAEIIDMGGSIILFSSMYGIISPNHHDYPEGINKNPVEYGAGKAAINQLTKYLAAEYGEKNIRVNSIAPGPFPNRPSQDMSLDFIENLASKTMLGRIGRRDEIAGTVLYLASDASSYMTGQVLSVDGGITSW